MSRLLWVSGPPAAGKSTLCHELAKRFDLAILIPVDDMREWVVSGYAGPVPWTDETERQYVISEEAACGVAARYVRAGFTAIIDSCRNPSKIDERLASCVPGVPAVKVLLMPSLSENLNRAHRRTNKDFESNFLDDVIEFTNGAYRISVGPGWMVIDNTSMSIDDEIGLVLDAMAVVQLP